MIFSGCHKRLSRRNHCWSSASRSCSSVSLYGGCSWQPGTEFGGSPELAIPSSGIPIKRMFTFWGLYWVPACSRYIWKLPFEVGVLGGLEALNGMARGQCGPAFLVRRSFCLREGASKIPGMCERKPAFTVLGSFCQVGVHHT